MVCPMWMCSIVFDGIIFTCDWLSHSVYTCQRSHGLMEVSLRSLSPSTYLLRYWGTNALLFPHTQIGWNDGTRNTLLFHTHKEVVSTSVKLSVRPLFLGGWRWSWWNRKLTSWAGNMKLVWKHHGLQPSRKKIAKSRTSRDVRRMEWKTVREAYCAQSTRARCTVCRWIKWPAPLKPFDNGPAHQSRKSVASWAYTPISKRLLLPRSTAWDKSPDLQLLFIITDWLYLHISHTKKINWF